MLLCEIFSTGGEMKDRLRQAALDIITPFIGQDLPFITIPQVIDALRSRDLGIMVDRGLLLDVLNPEEVKAVDKIQGDHIILAKPDGEDDAMADDQADQQKNDDHVSDMAQQAAKSAMQAPPPTPPAR